MKKNKFLKLASGLLVLCLLTTCVISTTFAKYVTEDSASDTARVAKWGVQIAVQADAFATEYDATTNVEDESHQVIAKTVISSTTDNLVAPGTNGTLATATITGTPEVAVNVTKVANLTLTGWEVDVTDDSTVNPTYYCPIVITIDGVEYKGTSYSSMADFESAVEGALNSNINYVPKTDLADSHTITWAWAFAGEDVKDTALGDAATAATISFEFSITATQID